MDTITLTKNNRIILHGFALSVFFAVTLLALPATADPVLKLGIVGAAKFNQIALDNSGTEAMELDFPKPEFIAALKNTSNQTDFTQLGAQRPVTVVTKPDFFTPKISAATEKKENKLDFTSLDGFFISLTEQSRDEPLSARSLYSRSTDYAGRDQPEMSRSNLLNSPFAHLVVKKLTGPFKN